MIICCVPGQANHQVDKVGGAFKKNILQKFCYDLGLCVILNPLRRPARPAVVKPMPARLNTLKAFSKSIRHHPIIMDKARIVHWLYWLKATVARDGSQDQSPKRMLHAFAAYLLYSIKKKSTGDFSGGHHSDLLGPKGLRKPGCLVMTCDRVNPWAWDPEQCSHVADLALYDLHRQSNQNLRRLHNGHTVLSERKTLL